MNRTLHRDPWPIVAATLVVAAVIGIGTLVTSCSGDLSEDPDVMNAIRSCIAAGGDPKIVTDRYGTITHYLGCVKP